VGGGGSKTVPKGGYLYGEGPLGFLSKYKAPKMDFFKNGEDRKSLSFFIKLIPVKKTL
jgi:hypothetical protein